MIKLTLGIAAVVAILIAQVPPEPTPAGDGAPGPFANSGQLILAIIVIVMPVLVRAWDSRTAAQREAHIAKLESEKEARVLAREKEKDELALRQREMDEAKADRQRQYDLEDRRDARQDADRQNLQRAAEIKAELEATRVHLEKKVDENTLISRTAADKASEIDTKIASLVKPYNNLVDEDRRKT